MGNCKDCRFWDPDGKHEFYSAADLASRKKWPDKSSTSEHRVCQRVDLIDEGSDPKSSKAFMESSSEGASFGDEFITAPDFGCVLFEQLDQDATEKS